MLQRYLGKIFLCLIISILFSYTPFDSSVTNYFKDKVSNEWLLIIKYLIINIVILIVSDFIIYLVSDEVDRVSHWKEKYTTLKKSYDELKNKNKSLIHFFLGIIEKSDFKVSTKKGDVINEISKLLENDFKSHIENTDFSILIERCETIKELVISQKQLRTVIDDIDIMNINTL
ncbi:hypothetical protein ACEE49_07400 [[Pasteurella] aerogenes]